MAMKPAWPLGLSIWPHHFSNADAYHEECVRRAVARVDGDAWGVDEIDWDVPALSRGQLVLQHLEATLEDGTEIRVGVGEGAKALSIPLSDLGSRTSLRVYVGLPIAQPGAPNVDAEGATRALHRYALSTHTLSDIANGGKTIDAQWLRPNVFLLTENDRLHSYDVVQCARLILDEAGNPMLDRSFIPPVWRIRASTCLTERLDALLSDLVARKTWADSWKTSEAFADRRILLRSLLGGFIADVADLRSRRHTAPHDAYACLVEILFALAPFTATGECPEPPPFNHRELDTTFLPLFEAIAEVLQSIGQARYRTIALVPTENDAWLLRADLHEPGIFDHEFFLAITGSDPGHLVEEAPKLLKIGALHDLMEMRYAAVSGVPLERRARPSGLPESNDTVYFWLDKRSDAFVAAMRTAWMGIYCRQLPGVTRIHLYAVQPGDAT
ncbi:type VI secretion system baseplate subunit TssK [Pendulispora brunnea]|uniref:Type VI secretion system baseplate subunit TssK n=1 Tax=Pendulispora brunnea TaxID=2905690 RepID=A0ABZ2KH63_9BACT